jgi:LysR family transcriptional regulator, nitrogen assimilation regulatory protein
MDFKQLQTFVQVAELSSFTRAAQVLRTAQPALSRQVRALEVELRQNLFDRNGRGVTLTPAGQRLLAHGRGILQQLQRAQEDLAEQRGAASGVLCVGLPPSVSRTLTAPLVQAFRQRFPKARLSIVEGLSTYLLEWLAQGRVDCALVYNAAPSAGVELLPVLQERLFAVSARLTKTTGAKNPRALPLAELAQRELVMPSRPHAIRMRVETVLAQAALTPRIALEIDSVPAMLDLVQQHKHWHALLSLNALRGTPFEATLQAQAVRLPYAQAVQAAQAPQTHLSTSLSLATSTQRPRGSLLEQAAALMTQLLRQHLATR